jgi:hypothetical protein
MTAVLRFPPDVFTLDSAGESAALRVRLGEPSPDLSAAADLDLSSDQATFMQLVAGQSTPEDAAAGGALRLHRGAERLGAWLERFRPPAAMAGPTGA